MRVLIVEDARERVAWFERRLHGHELFVTDKPPKAIQWLTQHTFDFIFLDHDLAPHHYSDHPPIMGEGVEERYLRIHSHRGTGRDVSRWLKAHPECNAEARIVIHTWNSTAAEIMLGDLAARGAVRQVFGPELAALWRR